MAESFGDVRKFLESGKILPSKPMLALPPSPLEVVEVTDPKSPEFKKAMEIYRKTFPEEEREEEYRIARHVRNTQKNGSMKPGDNTEFHLVAIKDNSIPGKDKIIGQAQLTYIPGKRWGTLLYVSIDPEKRNMWRKVQEGIGNFKGQIERYAAKHGEKPIGLFMDVLPGKDSMGNVVANSGYFFDDIKFQIPPVRKGGNPADTRFAFIPYHNVDLPGWAVKDIISDYMVKGGFYVGKDVKNNPSYQKSIGSIKNDHLYRFAKKV